MHNILLTFALPVKRMVSYAPIIFRQFGLLRALCLFALIWGNSNLRAEGSAFAVVPGHPPLDPSRPLIGTLECQPSRMAATNDAGARGVVIGIDWDRYETSNGQFDARYLKHVREEIDAFRAGGKLIVIDLGVQYPPSWIFSIPSSHFKNQYAEAYDPVPGIGDCGVNLVFSQEMRNKFEAYVGQIFRGLGTDFYAVRLGGGHYGELCYPINTYRDHTNCYWAFDAIAEGQQPGLASGLSPNPVASWIPGTASPNHDCARRFLNWYMASMENYHDWQITMLRKYFSGPLFMMYPSTGGLRPGQLDAAINDDCNGATGAEKTGEVGRGFDTARFITGITDPLVVVYSTWIDGFPGSDDSATDPKRWSPGHYLASLAAAHNPPLQVGGENTGHPDDVSNLELTFRRMREYHLSVMFWAFEGTLFDHKDNHATIEDFKKAVYGR
jgi:hypothetical protein